MTAQPDLCLFCDAPATHLCDAPLAMVLGGTFKPKRGPAYAISTMEAMLSGSHACDAPFCADHGKTVGHICGRNFHETIDHCCMHAAGERDGGLKTLEEIAAMRRALHAEWRRARFITAPPTPRSTP